MTIPPAALERIEARLRSLPPGEGARIEVVLDAVRLRNGTLQVKAELNLGERFSQTVAVDSNVE